MNDRFRIVTLLRRKAVTVLTGLPLQSSRLSHQADLSGAADIETQRSEGPVPPLVSIFA
jgi:hypothetical protein